MDDCTSNIGGNTKVRIRTVRAGVAVILALAAAGVVAGCGTDDRSPLDTVRALESPPASSPRASDRPTDRPSESATRPPRRTTAPPIDGTSSSASASASSSSSRTAAPATGPAAPYLNDPCKLLTVAEVASFIGLPVVKAEVDEKLRSSSSSFCDYRDSRGLSMMTVMMSTSDPRYSTAEQAAKGTIGASDNPVALAGVGDAAFTYRDSTANGVVWTKRVGDTYLDADVYIDRSDKDVPPDVLATIARTMIGRV